MALKRKGRYWYGSSLEDTQAEMLKFSDGNGHRAVRFAAAVCSCGGRAFTLDSDEEVGAAKRTCTACGREHLMGDSDEHADEAVLERHACVCGAQVFALLSGVALYDDSQDVRWYYIGCLCAACQLVGVFAEWKCEAGDADVFLAKT